MDPQDIEQSLKQLDAQKRWVKEATMEKLASASEGAIRMSTVAEFLRSGNKTAAERKQIFDKLTQDLKKLALDDDKDFDELGSIISDTFKDAFRPGSMKNLYDYATNTDLKDAAKELQEKSNLRMELAASHAGAKHKNIKWLVRSAGLLKAAGLYVAVASEVLSRAIAKKEDLNPMIERGMTVSTYGALETVDQLKRLAKTAGVGMEGIMAGFDQAAGALTSISGMSINGVLNYAQLVSNLSKNTDRNYGFTFDDLGRFHAQEIEMLVELGMMEDIKQVNSLAYADTFDLTQKMALGMAIAAGKDRKQILEERASLMKAPGFQEAFLISADYYMEKFGKEGAIAIKNNVAQVGLAMSNLGVDQASIDATMNTLQLAVANARQEGVSIQTYMAQTDSEFLEVVNNMPDPQAFFDVLDSALDPNNNPLDINKQMGVVMQDLFKAGKMISADNDVARRFNELVKSTFVGGNEKFERFLKYSEAGVLEEERTKLESTDASVDLANAGAKISGTIDSFTDMSMKLAVGLSDLWGAIMQLMGQDIDELLKESDIGISSSFWEGVNPENSTRLEEVASRFTRGLLGSFQGLPAIPGTPNIVEEVKEIVNPGSQAPIKPKDVEVQTPSAPNAGVPIPQTPKPGVEVPSTPPPIATNPNTPTTEESEPQVVPLPMGGKNIAEIRQNIAMQFFMDMGMTSIQAAGMVGNLMRESTSNLDPRANGDSGKAWGLAQWREDKKAGARAVKFREIMGKDVWESTFEDQLKFIQWELEHTHRRAYTNLKKASTIEEAAYIVDRQYEVSKETAENTAVRRNNAMTVHNRYTAGDRGTSMPRSKTPEFDMSASQIRLQQMKADRQKMNERANSNRYGNQLKYLEAVKSLDSQIATLQAAIAEHTRVEVSETQ